MRKLINNKLFKIIFISFIIIITSYLALIYYAWYPEKGIKYLLPEKYKGWICVTYNVKGSSSLEKQDDFFLLKVLKNGTIKTSSSLNNYSKEGYYIPTYDEYYYYSEKGIRVAEELAMGGGFTTQNEGSDEITSYFWISTKENLENDYKKYVKDRDVLQNPQCGEWKNIQ
ncbi:MAG: Unknown protein [uncultured Sulfurovum sp.]|uniref:DUF6843 domain-containing protein n=1 Tax=uncultured Sulfurovum sp. TaxID=269237 RepID=A0A6S6TPQ7_9BACT|nr:MAG: Unknown protein [uncultured Sulfurovum sp.]